MWEWFVFLKVYGVVVCFFGFRGCGDAVHVPQLEEEDMSDCLCQYNDLITQDERKVQVCFL